MSRADVLVGVLWLGLTLYTLFGGADYGGGIWHLVAGRTRSGAAQRDLVEHAIGPVWEANHVWLIFVITLFWTVFPPAFAAFAATLYIPLTLVALGVIGRGAAFAFRKATDSPRQQRAYGLAFGISSVLTPFVLGTIAGALASGRVPPRIGAGDIVHSWLNPTSVYCGLLAVGSCAYLAGVYLTGDAARERAPDLAEAFRRRSLVTAVAVGVVALAGLAVLRGDAPRLVHGLTHRGLPAVLVSLAAGLASMALLVRRRYWPARVTAAITVAALLWGWGASQYPVLLYPDLTVARASAAPSVLSVVLVWLAVSAVLLVPALGWLLVLFQRDPGPKAGADRGTGSAPEA
jgi:cytochrome d ubiquinol oxidase subunit II